MRTRTVVVLFLLVLTLTGCQEKDPPISINLLKGQDTVEINTEWIDSGARLYVGDTEYSAVPSGDVDTSTLGQYDVEYHYEYGGKEYTISRYIMVVDQTPPEISLTPGVDTVQVGNLWVDAGATVSDNSLEVLDILSTGIVNTSAIGTYEITYSAIDSSGNTSYLVRYVDVIE